MAEATTQLSIQELYYRVSQLLRNNLDMFKGLTISGVSIDDKLNESSFASIIYCTGTSSLDTGNKVVNNKINLGIPKSIIDTLKKENPGAGKVGTRYDIVIDTLFVSPMGQITVMVQLIKETGLSARELLNRKLAKYCEEKGYSNIQKRSLPRIVTSLMMITSEGSTISDDILSNLALPMRKISQHKCKTSEEIATLIAKNTDSDIVVLFRGGREDEYMAIFSSECIIDAIVQSRVPVCIALGHDIDKPFIYTVGDAEYSTPSAFAKAIAELNRNAKNDQRQLFERMKERLVSITNTVSGFVSLRQERIENLCKQIVIAKIKGIEIIEKKIAGDIDATKVKAISAIDLRKKQIDIVINQIIHDQKSSIDKRLSNIEILVNEAVGHKKSSLDKCLHRIERLADEIIGKEDTRQKTEAIQDKANKDKRNIITGFAIIFIAFIAFIVYLLFKQ